MKFEEYIGEGRAKFWKGSEEYYIRDIGGNKYQVAVFVRGDTPDVVYTTTEKTCDCPSRKIPCKHIQMVKKWIKEGKPSAFGKSVKKGVLDGLKKMGVKV